MTFAVGSLVRARGREWVVLPESEEDLLAKRSDALLDAHRRVRQATRTTGVSQHIEPQLPVDVLGVYVYLPVES